MEKYNFASDLLTNISIDKKSCTPKYLQLANSILDVVESGISKTRVSLPSIAQLAASLGLSKDTVERSYKYLKENGVLHPSYGKGHYVNLDGFRKAIKICLVLNKLSNQKKELHQALSDKLGSDVLLDIYVYNNSFSCFQRIIESTKENYSHYLIIPHFNNSEDQAAAFINSSIQKSKLIVLDRKLEGLDNDCACIYESFQEDIYDALEQMQSSLKKYSTIKLIFPSDSHFPRDIHDGLTSFCNTYSFKKEVIPSTKNESITAGTLYICLTENDLVDLVERVNEAGLNLGSDVGVISYNDSPVKRYIGNGITTFSTDYRTMGAFAADMILNKYSSHIKLPFSINYRASV